MDEKHGMSTRDYILEQVEEKSSTGLYEGGEIEEIFGQKKNLIPFVVTSAVLDWMEQSDAHAETLGEELKLYVSLDTKQLRLALLDELLVALIWGAEQDQEQPTVILVVDIE